MFRVAAHLTSNRTGNVTQESGIFVFNVRLSWDGNVLSFFFVNNLFEDNLFIFFLHIYILNGIKKIVSDFNDKTQMEKSWNSFILIDWKIVHD